MDNQNPFLTRSSQQENDQEESQEVLEERRIADAGQSQAMYNYSEKLLEQKEKELMESIAMNYGRIREVERELGNLQLQLKLTSGPKKHALELLRKKIETQNERVAYVRAKHTAAKAVFEKLDSELKQEEAIKEQLCGELNTLVQQAAKAQLDKLEELKSTLEGLYSGIVPRPSGAPLAMPQAVAPSGPQRAPPPQQQQQEPQPSEAAAGQSAEQERLRREEEERQEQEWRRQEEERRRQEAEAVEQRRRQAEAEAAAARSRHVSLNSAGGRSQEGSPRAAVGPPAAAAPAAGPSAAGRHAGPGPAGRGQAAGAGRQAAGGPGPGAVGAGPGLGKARAASANGNGEPGGTGSQQQRQQDGRFAGFDT